MPFLWFLGQNMNGFCHKLLVECVNAQSKKQIWIQRLFLAMFIVAGSGQVRAFVGCSQADSDVYAALRIYNIAADPAGH